MCFVIFNPIEVVIKFNYEAHFLLKDVERLRLAECGLNGIGMLLIHIIIAFVC